ncbi:hypothetical protein SAMN05660649_00988 [Desulfotomaculum arcticum]|uniref:DUF7479 domain-containing protein n=1 Tax=Desulfotruncus arcticus DSM 17038 TaxID=1121424 RepID=A0A1I2Q0Q4_9FIRM|nr:CLJU_RS11820 family redox protein [Desulfotruncus arcticus]SFG21480.1 hypothetical protein SAMN05660649_00988 [Desulfotomaculum arcticum] [Desulfotruncus arcticus DSM 17038]
MTEKKTLICYQCKVELEMAKTCFEYLGLSFHTNVLKCPKCGLVFIPEDLAKGRMAEVEKQLEDK